MPLWVVEHFDVVADIGLGGIARRIEEGAMGPAVAALVGDAWGASCSYMSPTRR